ncbi:hypothetical protein BDF22DRAFT_324542 [Syncephalis plumigaleata]|nr:hypothetical protein BDF22DRAFT_324542 [Syncephalis plumigaleata]
MVSNISNNFQFTRDLWNQTVLSSMLTTTIILVFSSNLASAAMRVWTRRRLTNSLHALQAVVGMLIFCLLLVQIYIPKECDLIIGVYMMGSYVGTACLDGVLLLKAYYANRCWHPILIIGAILEMFRLIAFAFTTATNEVALSPWGTCITTSIGSAALFVRVCADVIQNIFLSLCFILPILRQSKLWIDARRATSLQHPTDRSLSLSPRAQPIAGIASVGYTTGKSTAITAFIGNQPVHPHASQRQNSDTRHNDRMLVTNRSRSDNVDAIQLHNNNHSHNGSGSNAGLSLSVANRISNTYHDRYTQTSNIQRVSQLADRAIQPAATSEYSTNAAYPPIRQHINSTPQPNKLVDNQPQRIYDQLVQDGAFYAFFVNVANLYCTAVVYWTLWGDLSSLAFIITCKY